METKKITKADLDINNYFKEDSLDFEGHIEIEENLGYWKTSSQRKNTIWNF